MPRRRRGAAGDVAIDAPNSPQLPRSRRINRTRSLRPPANVARAVATGTKLPATNISMQSSRGVREATRRARSGRTPPLQSSDTLMRPMHRFAPHHRPASAAISTACTRKLRTARPEPASSPPSRPELTVRLSRNDVPRLPRPSGKRPQSFAIARPSSSLRHGT